jgi:hypothetical protein
VDLSTLQGAVFSEIIFSGYFKFVNEVIINILRLGPGLLRGKIVVILISFKCFGTVVTGRMRDVGVAAVKKADTIL